MRDFVNLETLKGVYVKKFALAISFTIMLALFAQIRIPLFFTPVPLTLQSLGILLIGYYLGSSWGLLSVLFYVILGAMGLPFFAGLRSGLLVLSGPTGGYLFGFLVAVYIVGKAKEVGWLKSPFYSFLLALFAHFVIYFFGALWWVAGIYPATKNLKEVFLLTVAPFIISDTFKCILFAGFIFAQNKFSEAVRR